MFIVNGTEVYQFSCVMNVEYFTLDLFICITTVVLNLDFNKDRRFKFNLGNIFSYIVS